MAVVLSELWSVAALSNTDIMVRSMRLVCACLSVCVSVCVGMRLRTAVYLIRMSNRIGLLVHLLSRHPETAAATYALSGQTLVLWPQVKPIIWWTG